MQSFIRRYFIFIKIALVFCFMASVLFVSSAVYTETKNNQYLFQLFVLTILFSFCMPWILRLFGRTGSYTGIHLDMLHKLASAQQIGGLAFYIKKHRHANAAALGFGPSRAVLLTTTLLSHPIDDIRAVVTHELGHHKHADPLRYTFIVAFGLVFASWTNSILFGQFNQTVPLWVINLLVSAAVFLSALHYSRSRERLADQYTKLAINNDDFAQFLERALLAYEKEGIYVPENPSIVLKSLSSHPWIFDRILFFKK